MWLSIVRTFVWAFALPQLWTLNSVRLNCFSSNKIFRNDYFGFCRFGVVVGEIIWLNSLKKFFFSDNWIFRLGFDCFRVLCDACGESYPNFNYPVQQLNIYKLWMINLQEINPDKTLIFFSITLMHRSFSQPFELMWQIL